MTSAQQNTGVSLAITIDDSKSVNPRQLWKVRWWHTKAYVTVLSILLLTLISLIFLRIHWSCRRLLPILMNRGVREQEWDTFSSK